MALSTENVTRKSKKVKEIYLASFPKEERMPYLLMLVLSKMPTTEFLSFHEKGQVCGFAYLAMVDHIVFIMFLAVDPPLRSQGYGSRILDEIQKRYPRHKIIVSIERCDEAAENREQRLQRKKFYLKNGYAETGYYIELSHVKQEVIIKNGEFDPEEFSGFFKKYSNGTMNPKIWPAGSRE